MIVKEFIVSKSKFKNDDQFYIGYIRNGHFKKLSIDNLTRYFGIEVSNTILGVDTSKYFNYKSIGFIDVNKTNEICEKLNLLLMTETLKGNTFKFL